MRTRTMDIVNQRIWSSVGLGKRQWKDPGPRRAVGWSVGRNRWSGLP